MTQREALAQMDEADFDILAGKIHLPDGPRREEATVFPTGIRESLKLVARLIPGGKGVTSHMPIHIIMACGS